MIPLYRPITGEKDVAAIRDVLQSGWLTTGPQTARFEQAIATYLGCKNAIGVSSCTAALHLSLLALNVGPGDEVITTPMTFVATANAICYTGAKPVFADVDNTLCLDPKAAEAAITDKTVVIIPVHLYGGVCDVDGFTQLRNKYGVSILYDCAHAVEARLNDIPAPIFGKASCLSHYACKNLTTGEGGTVITYDDELAQKIRVLRNHGLEKTAWEKEGEAIPQLTMLGYKYNMSDIQAALGLVQLERLEYRWKRRQEIADIYDRELTDVERPATRKLVRHAHHLYPIMVDNRDGLATFLSERGIATGIQYRPVHLEPYYRERFGFTKGIFPNAERAGERLLSIPLWPGMSNSDVWQVVEGMKIWLSGR